jgi:hypothetical protein
MSLIENNQITMSSTLLTIKEYFTTFSSLSNVQFSETWGWFVDIESNQVNFPIKSNKYPRYTSKHVYIPPTINEVPSIRSFKSMRNLHDHSMIFKMDEDFDKYHIYRNTGCLIHSICIIGLIGLLYGCKIL